jgi:hypothetical protein
MPIRSDWELRRWLAREIVGKDIERKPPKRASALHSPPERNAQYRTWVRSLPCAVCETTFGVEACHTGPHGLQQKASDYSCIPLCIEHHRGGNAALDKIGRVAFEAKFNLRIGGLIKQLHEAWRTSAKDL